MSTHGQHRRVAASAHHQQGESPAASSASLIEAGDDSGGENDDSTGLVPPSDAAASAGGGGSGGGGAPPPTAAARMGAAVFYATTSLATVFVNKLVLTSYAFPSPLFLAGCQASACFFLLSRARPFRHLSAVRVTRNYKGGVFQCAARAPARSLSTHRRSSGRRRPS